ncbi:hypothetical protein ACFLZP_03810, partial [Patescibacteria group bacterium]
LAMLFFFQRCLSPADGVLSKNRLGWFLATLALVYTDYYGWWIVLAQNLVVMIERKFLKKRKDSFWFWWQIFLIVAYLPWLPMFFKQLATGRQAMVTLPGWGRLVNLSFLKSLPLTFVKFSLGRISVFNKRLYWLVAGGVFLVYSWIISKVLFPNSPLRRTPTRSLRGYFGRFFKILITNPSQLTALCWFLIPILGSWLVSLWVPNYQPFRLLSALPAFYLLLALGVAETKNLRLKIGELLLVVVISLASLGVYFSDPYFQREDWRGVVKFLENRPQAVAILPSQTSAWPWRYYSGGKAELVTPSSGVRKVSEEDFQDLEMSNLSLGNSDWYYIRYLVPLFDPEEKIEAWFGANSFVKIKEHHFNQIPVWEFRKEGEGLKKDLGK